MYGDKFDKAVDYYNGTYKKGILSKKQTIELDIRPDYIEGTGFRFMNGELRDETVSFKIMMGEIKEINSIKNKDENGICIKYQLKKSVVQNSESSMIMLMGIADSDRYVKVMEDCLKKYNEKQEQELNSRRLYEKQQEEQLALAEQTAETFYQNCMNFHIHNQEKPCYSVYQEKLKSALIYIDQDKNLNFLRVDGYSETERNNSIAYDKIHYYEKAGTIHYTPQINGEYSSFGGSYTGSNFSKSAALISGLLFGPVGLAAGALFSYKPAEMEPPQTHLELSSKIQKIDDRNVILNYYSDVYKQYIDMELPADIFNFLQTHLPDKKHNIVLELEKQTAVNQVNGALGMNQEPAPKSMIQENNDMGAFKQKLEKLKLMKDSGILTDEEFEEAKGNILASL